MNQATAVAAAADIGTGKEALEAQMIEAFIKTPEKFDWYKGMFARMEKGDSWAWSWWAFFGGWAWLLYRKQYTWALGIFTIGFALSFIPFGSLAVAILVGGLAPSIIYKDYAKTKTRIAKIHSDPEMQIESMQYFGGVNVWVKWVIGVVYILVLGILFAGFFAGPGH